MSNREELHEVLCDILGSRNAYFNPPETVKMKYPAIRYKRAKINNKFADNKVFIQQNTYNIVVIDKDPESPIVTKVSQMPGCMHSQHYISDGLYHDVFTLNY